MNKIGSKLNPNSNKSGPESHQNTFKNYAKNGQKCKKIKISQLVRNFNLKNDGFVPI